MVFLVVHSLDKKFKCIFNKASEGNKDLKFNF